MKSETQVRQELELLQRDLKAWQGKYERADPRDTIRKTILGNTMVGLEGRLEALRWMLQED